MWFQHENALTHQPAGMQSFLKDWFGQQIIGYSGSVQCPPQSDLTPIKSFLLSYLKDQVYAAPHTSLLELRYRIYAFIFHAKKRAFRITLTHTNLYLKQ